MFEYEGAQFTLEQVQQAADKRNLSLDDYISQFNITRLEGPLEEVPGKQTSQVPGAPAVETAAPEDTVSKPEDTSLVSQYPINRGSSLRAEKRKQSDGQLQPVVQENYKENYENFLQNRNSEERYAILKGGNYDPYEPKISDAWISNTVSGIVGIDETAKQDPKRLLRTVLNQDKYMTDLSRDIISVHKADILSKRKDIAAKYDLSKEDQVEKANEEFDDYIKLFVGKKLGENKTFVERSNYIQNKVLDAYKAYDIEAGRERLGISDNPAIEGLQKWYARFSNDVKKATLFSKANEIGGLQKLDPNSQILYGGYYSEKEGTIIGAKTVKVADVLPELKKDIAQVVNEVGLNESDLAYFNEFDVDKALSGSPEDIVGLLTEQVPNAVVAKLTYGMGLWVSEFGRAYYSNIEEYLKSTGQELTQENFIKAADEGRGQEAIAATSASIISSLEYVGANNIAKGILGKAGRKSFSRLTKDGLKSFIKEGGAKELGKTAGKSSFVEYLTEGFQGATEQVQTYTAARKNNLDRVFMLDMDRIAKEAKTGGFVGGILPISARVVTSAKDISTETFLRATKGFKGQTIDQAAASAINQLDQELKVGNITQEERDYKANEVRKIREVNSKVPNQVKDKDRADVIRDLVELNSLKEENKNIDPAFEAIVNENNRKIAEIATRINDKIKIGTEQAFTTKDNVAPVAERIGYSFQETTFEEYKKTSEQKYDEDSVYAAEIVPGKITWFSDVAEQTITGKAPKILASAAAHELLHPVIDIHVLDQGKAEEFSTGIKEIIGEENAKLLDEQILERYNAKPGDETYYKEFFTVLSDLEAKNSIKLPDNRSFIQKIQDFFKKLFGQYNIEIGFENAEQTLNFIKRYSKEAKSREGFSEDIIKIIDPELIKSSIKPKAPAASKTQKELNERVDNLVGEKDASGKYKWNSKEEFQSSEEFMNVYDKIINGNLIDPLIRRGIEGDVIYGKPIERFIEDVKDGLTGTIMRFDPSQNDSLIGFINKQLAFRKGDVSNRYKKEYGEFGTSSIDIEAGEVGSLRELADEEVDFDELIDQVEQEEKVLDTATVFGQEFAPLFKEEFDTNIANIDTESINSFKDVPRLVTNTVASVFNVNPAKITDPKKNLSSGEARAAQEVIFKIADKIIDILAKGAVTEAASEELLGTSTGMPKNLLKNFYEKDPQRRTEAQGLYEFKKRTDLTKEDVLEAFGMDPEGNQLPGFSARTPQAQTIKAFLSFLDKMISNSELRKMLAKNGGDLNKIQNIAAGKSEAVFSKAVLSQGSVDLSNDQTLEVINEEYALRIFSGALNLRSSKAMDANGNLTPGGKITLDVATKLLNSFEGDKVKELRYFRILGRAFSHGTTKKTSLFDGNQKIVNYFKNNNIGLNIGPGGSLYYNNEGESVRLFERTTYDKNSSVLQKALKLAEQGDFNLLKDIYEDQSLLFQKELIQFFRDTKNFLDSSNIESGNKSIFINNILTYMFKPTNSFATLAAKATGFSMLKDKTDSYTFDHRPPLAMIQRLAALYFNSADPDSKVLEDAIYSMEGAFISLKVHNDLINKFDKKSGAKYQSTQQKGYKFGDDVYEAYANKGVEVTRIAQPNKKSVAFSKVKIKPEEKVSSDLENKFAAMIAAKDARITPGQKLDLATAKNLAAKRKKRFDIITPGANDFDGLMYVLLAKGKLGEEQYQWITENLYQPYGKAHYKLNNTRQRVARSYKKIEKENKPLFKKLKEDSGFGGFTFEQALRVWMFSKIDKTPSGVDEDTQKALISIVKNNPEIETLGYELSNILPMTEFWVEPDAETWQVDTLKTDVINAIEKVTRKQYLTEWKDNVDQIFSQNNMNKLTAAFGEDYVSALKDMLYRMETGSSRPEGSNKQMNMFMNWVRGSVATTMFFNRRSAVLQQISNVNFLNWGDNNPIAAAKAFANQKQYWEDFAFILNSNYLKERRGGLKTDVNAAELAEAAKKGGYKGVLGKILQAGFLLTQMGDSLAIATGGSTFYRNRINTYLKQGLSKEQAEEKAFLDFQEISEETQQSARPDRLSQQQTTVIGRVFLSFQNTPMQMTRLSVKAGKDMIAGRGNRFYNAFKMLYYGAIQSAIFSMLQTALIGDIFNVFEPEEDDDDKERKDKKTKRVINGIVDSFLKGTGMYGVGVATAKNALIKFIEQEERKEKGKRPDYTYVLLEGLNFSPPVGIKARNFYGALKNYEYNAKYVGAAGFSLNNPALDIGSAATDVLFNIPAMSTLSTIRDISAATDENYETMTRIALIAGWHTWDLGLEDNNLQEIKQEIKKRKQGFKKQKPKPINL